MTRKTPPDDLSLTARRLWMRLNRDWELDLQSLMVLRIGLLAYDQAISARAQILKDGAVLTTPTGFSKPHPLLAIEKEARQGFLQAWRMLAFNVEPPAFTGKSNNFLEVYDAQPKTSKVR